LLKSFNRAFQSLVILIVLQTINSKTESVSVRQSIQLHHLMFPIFIVYQI